VRAGLTALTLLITPALATSQARLGREFAAIGVNGGLFVLGGQDFQVTDDALGAEANVSVHVAGPVFLGVGGHYSSHGTVVAAPLRIVGVFLEPQAVFSIGRNAVLRFGVRGGWLHRSIEASTTNYKSSGKGLGVEAAADYSLGGPLAIEGAATLDYLSFDSLFPSGNADTGTAFGLHVGCRLGLGR
jgi:hypothetical protein